MASIRKKRFTPRASDLEGRELTKYLEGDPRILELIAAGHGGWDNLPAYLRLRYERLSAEARKAT